MSKEKVPKRQYTEEFKVESARLAESVGSHEAARRLGIPVATLGNWTRRRRVVAPADATGTVCAPIRRPSTGLEAEVSRLRRELASAKLNIEILRKATAYFVKGSR
jgi:transposase